MNIWNLFIPLCLGALLLALWRRRGRINREQFRDLLEENGQIFDVRTEAEFQAQHLPGVRNLPLNRIGQEIEGVVSDKSSPILLHCASGARSAAACTMLRRKGYARVFNLGSFTQAACLLREPSPRSGT